MRWAGSARGRAVYRVDTRCRPHGALAGWVTVTVVTTAFCARHFFSFIFHHSLFARRLADRPDLMGPFTATKPAAVLSNLSVCSRSLLALFTFFLPHCNATMRRVQLNYQTALKHGAARGPRAPQKSIGIQYVRSNPYS